MDVEIIQLEPAKLNVRRLREAYAFTEEMVRQVKADELLAEDKVLYSDCTASFLVVKRKLIDNLGKYEGEVSAVKNVLASNRSEPKKCAAIEHVLFTAHPPSNQPKFYLMLDEASECVGLIVELADKLFKLKQRLDSADYKGKKCLNQNLAIAGAVAAILGVILLVLPGCSALCLASVAAKGALVSAGCLIGGYGAYGIWKGLSQVSFDEAQLEALKALQISLATETEDLKHATMMHKRVLSTEIVERDLRQALGEDLIDLAKMQLFCDSFDELWNAVATPTRISNGRNMSGLVVAAATGVAVGAAAATAAVGSAALSCIVLSDEHVDL